MRFGDLMNRAKKVVDQRGGTDALKKDAEELKNIARGPGSAQEKAKRAADALKDPGARGAEMRPDPAETRPDPAETQRDPPETQRDPAETQRDPAEGQGPERR